MQNNRFEKGNNIMQSILALFIPIIVLSIPISAIFLSYKHKSELAKIKELELQKEILELEIKKQSTQIKLLEAESEKYDKIINGKSV
jgi:hypothetical protein